MIHGCVCIYIYLYIHLHQVNCQSLFWLLLFQSLLCLGWVPQPVLATTRAKQTCQGYSSTFCTHKLIASHSTIVGSCLLGSFLSKGCVVHKWNSTAVSLHFFQVIPGPPEVDHWSDHWTEKQIGVWKQILMETFFENTYPIMTVKVQVLLTIHHCYPPDLLPIFKDPVSHLNILVKQSSLQP